jgi:hypothetical protein
MRQGRCPGCTCGRDDTGAPVNVLPWHSGALGIGGKFRASWCHHRCELLLTRPIRQVLRPSRRCREPFNRAPRFVDSLGSRCDEPPVVHRSEPLYRALSSIRPFRVTVSCDSPNTPRAHQNSVQPRGEPAPTRMYTSAHRAPLLFGAGARWLWRYTRFTTRPGVPRRAHAFARFHKGELQWCMYLEVPRLHHPFEPAQHGRR